MTYTADILRGWKEIQEPYLLIWRDYITREEKWQPCCGVRSTSEEEALRGMRESKELGTGARQASLPMENYPSYSFRGNIVVLSYWHFLLSIFFDFLIWKVNRSAHNANNQPKIVGIVGMQRDVIEYVSSQPSMCHIGCVTMYSYWNAWI